MTNSFWRSNSRATNSTWCHHCETRAEPESFKVRMRRPPVSSCGVGCRERFLLGGHTLPSVPIFVFGVVHHEHAKGMFILVVRSFPSSCDPFLNAVCGRLLCPFNMDYMHLQASPVPPEVKNPWQTEVLPLDALTVRSFFAAVRDGFLTFGVASRVNHIVHLMDTAHSSA